MKKKISYLSYSNSTDDALHSTTRWFFERQRKKWKPEIARCMADNRFDPGTYNFGYFLLLLLLLLVLKTSNVFCLAGLFSFLFKLNLGSLASTRAEELGPTKKTKTKTKQKKIGLFLLLFKLPSVAPFQGGSPIIYETATGTYTSFPIRCWYLMGD